MSQTRTLLALIAGTCVSYSAYAGDDHGRAAPKDDHAPAAEKHDAPAEAAKPKRRPAKLKTTTKEGEASKPSDATHTKADEAPAKAAEANSHGETNAPKIEKSASDEADPHATPAVQPVAHASSMTADEALKLLTEGNQRWVSNNAQNPSCDNEQRSEQANGQTPFVTILTCADSRIPVERVFDRGVGEVFTIRVAGNVAGDSETGTIEYGLGHLHTKLLVVMGHTKCGAVKACVDGAHNGALHGKVRDLVASISPSVDRAKRNNPNADASELVNLAVKENVWQGVYNLMASSTEIRELVGKGDVKVVGAIYDIQSGKVEFLGEHPWQSELITAMNSATSGTKTTPAQPATAEAAEPHGH
ncbi:MAG TPA: carbonic anhydrase [Phycisphaerales bacterium]|nr:carbonic anhydrase [Phycisphaerales bacterium]